jgi:hypothetical protein
MEVLDAWTNVGGSDPACFSNTGGYPGAFCSLGTRNGTTAGDYAFVGPDWDKDKPLPAGITKVIRMPTNTAWIIGRTYTSGAPSDIETLVTIIQPQYKLTPLSSFERTARRSRIETFS